jgi:outer membrane protein TolC
MPCVPSSPHATLVRPPAPPCRLQRRAPLLAALSPQLPAAFKTSGPWRTAKPADHEPRGSWWAAFGDSRLSDLMKKAEAANPDLEAAAHRVTAAKAIARADSADLLPSVLLNQSDKTHPQLRLHRLQLRRRAHRHTPAHHAGPQL